MYVTNNYELKRVEMQVAIERAHRRHTEGGERLPPPRWRRRGER